MSRIFVVSLLTIALAGLCLADSHEKHAYQKAAAIHDLMEVMVKPSMDKIKAMSEAGGPANTDEWKEANSAASLLVEAAQLIRMDGRIKDDVWSDSSERVVAAARDMMMGAYRMDPESYNAALEATGAACKSCHDVHKKDKN